MMPLTEAEKEALARRCEQALDFAQFRRWLRELGGTDSAYHFVPRNTCQCPVAVYLRDKAGSFVDVGDDDVSYEANFLVELPSEFKRFVSVFDELYKPLEYVTPKDLARFFDSHWSGAP